MKKAISLNINTEFLESEAVRNLIITGQHRRRTRECLAYLHRSYDHNTPQRLFREVR